MEKISRRLWAPVHPGSIAATKWFYERARGQYRDRQAYGPTAMRKKFEAEFPKDQTLQKTDLAKYEMTFDCKPHVVSQGARKCFLAFAESISKAWESRSLDFNDEYFRHAVAKAILYRWTDRMVGRSDWYQADRGYKANIVAYTLAWLVNHLARERSCALDLARVWKMQDVPEEIQDALSDLAPRVAEIEQICRRHRLLSPRSAAALATLKLGQTNLARSELNAMSNLIERLRDVGVDLTEIAGAE